MKKIIAFSLIIMFSSCVPLRVAPEIDNYKIVKAKRFKRSLPKKHAFIFNDTKDAGEFYNFIDAKYDLDKSLLERIITFNLKDKIYVLSFYEVERTSKTLNLVPILIDANRVGKNKDTLLEDFHTSRSSDWYIAITIVDNNNTDCLNPDYNNNKKIETYLETLKNEYLTTNNYLETLLKR